MSAQAFDQIIQSRFAGQSGWFCLGTIDGDPDIEKLKQEWYLLPRQRSELAQRCAELAARGFNLYWAACLFGQRKRTYAAALPSNLLWQDDSPADMVCTELIQSSEQKYQAVIKLDRPITARERQRLQVAWRDKTPGADSCSGNAVQLGRMPGGYNCKRHARFLVNVASQTNKVWNADSLLAKAPALAEKACGIVTDLDWPAVEPHLTNIAALLASGRAGCIKPETQTGRILAGERVAIASAKLGRMDDSSSMQVAILSSGFLCRGFLDEEIAAVGMHFYREWGVETRKGTEWCKADIERCIALAHAHNPGVVQSPTRYRQQAPGITIVSRPAASRARADRPRLFDPAMLFARYQAQPDLCDQRRKARAAGLGISTATLDRLEDGLEAIGLIQIEAKPGMPGRVILLGGVINIPAPEVLSAPTLAPPPEAPIERAVSGENVDRSPQCIGETHPPPEAPRVWIHRAELADWTKEAFDAYPGRANFRKVLKHIEMLADGRRFNLVTLKRLYADERDRRAWERQIAKLQTMKYSALTKLSRQVERIIVGGESGPEAQQLGWARWYQPHIGAELDRRLDMKERLRPGKPRGATVEEILILAEIDDQRRQPPARQQGTRRGVCSPQTTLNTIQPDLFADAPAQSPYYVAALGIADRLRARQAVQL